MKPKEIRKELELILTPKRMQHTMGVVETAKEMAKLYEVNKKEAKIAALLHDCAKCYNINELYEQSKIYGLQLDDNLTKFPSVIHAFLGAKIAEIKYDIDNIDILNAIRYHTTGRANMSLLEKIIFVADYIEPNRANFEGLSEVRRLSKINIDEAFNLSINVTIKYLESKKLPLHPLQKEIIGG